MYRAGDAVDNEESLRNLEAAAEDLDLGDEAVATARDLFLSGAPTAERSKPPAVAASLYAASLVAGDAVSQRAAAEAVGVSRLAVQDRWKDLLREAGLEPPTW